MTNATESSLNAMSGRLQDWWRDVKTSMKTTTTTTTVGAPAAQPAPNVGSGRSLMLGSFELSDQLLGEGGYAKVVLGKNRETGEHVAVKLLDTRLDPSSGRAASSEAAIVREVAALRRAGSHVNVCGLLGYYRLGESGACHAMVMELCRGGELFKLVERYGAMDAAKIRPIFVGVLDGLRHLHAQGIAHRDLKLENILLAQPPGAAADAKALVPKICDLGLAHVHARGADGKTFAARDLTQFCGSRSYCAPEVMARLGYNGYAADIWSLGVCLFGLVSGFFPVDEASSRDWRYERIARLQYAHPSQSTTHAIYAFYQRPCPLSPALVNLLDHMLTVVPSKRSTLAEVTASPWVNGADQLPAKPPAPAAEAAVAAAETHELMRFDEEVDVSDYLQRSGGGSGTDVYRAAGLPEGAEAAPPVICRQRAEESVGIASALSL